MIICQCNVLCGALIDKAIRHGAATPEAVHAACGTDQCCGMCRPEIQDRIEDAQALYAIAAE